MILGRFMGPNGTKLPLTILVYYLTKWDRRKSSKHPFRHAHSDDVREDSNQLLRSAAYKYHQAKSKGGQDV